MNRDVTNIEVLTIILIFLTANLIFVLVPLYLNAVNFLERSGNALWAILFTSFFFSFGFVLIILLIAYFISKKRGRR